MSSNQTDFQPSGNAGLAWPLRMAGLVLAAYFYYDATHFSRGSLPLSITAFVVTIGLFGAFPRSAWVWGGAAVLLFACGAPRWTDLANHHWLLFYFSAAAMITLTAPPDQRGGVLRSNARWMIVVLMGFAVVQRILSVDYMTGGFFGYCFATGSFGKLLFETGISSSALEAFAENRETIASLTRVAPHNMKTVTLVMPFTGFTAISILSTYGVLAYEVAIALLFALRRTYAAAHVALMLFAAGLILVRPEVEFIALTQCLGLAATQPHERRLRMLYTVIILLSVVLVFVIHGRKHVML